MFSKVQIGYIDIRVFAHATEGTEKVLAAVRNILPIDLVGSVVFRKTNVTGHYGNPIVLFETRIKDRAACQMVFEKLASSLSLMDKELLNSEIGQHLENGNLYVRFDKQSAYLNKLKFSSVDPIRLRIHFKQHEQEDIMRMCRAVGLLP